MILKAPRKLEVSPSRRKASDSGIENLKPRFTRRFEKYIGRKARHHTFFISPPVGPAKEETGPISEGTATQDYSGDPVGHVKSPVTIAVGRKTVRQSLSVTRRVTMSF